MNKKRNFEKELPAGYREALYISGKGSRLGVVLNLVSAAITLLVMGIAVLFLYGGGRLTADAIGAGYGEWVIMSFVLLLLLVGYTALHELVHGAAYKLLTGERLTFGISLGCAFCGIPDAFAYRRTVIIAVCAPLITFTVILLPILILLYFVSPLYYLAISFLLATHLGGCSGDAYVLYLLLARFKDKKTLVRDTGPEQFFYVPEELSESN